VAEQQKQDELNGIPQSLPKMPIRSKSKTARLSMLGINKGTGLQMMDRLMQKRWDIMQGKEVMDWSKVKKRASGSWTAAAVSSSNSSTSSNYFSSTQNLSMHDLVKYKYAIEMLPWHLMRSLKYEEAADTLTDASFVKSRVLVLNVMDATTIHIADVEELKVRLTACVTQSERLQVDINEVFVSSYRLISSIFHCEMFRLEIINKISIQKYPL